MLDSIVENEKAWAWPIVWTIIHILNKLDQFVISTSSGAEKKTSFRLLYLFWLIRLMIYESFTLPVTLQLENTFLLLLFYVQSPRFTSRERPKYINWLSWVMFLEHETLSAWQLCSTGRTNTHTHPPQQKSAEQHHKTANVTRPSTPSIHITAKNSKKCKIRQNTE